jgi:hypothetical protein
MFLLNTKFDEFDWTMSGWGALLDLAAAHGWQPAGTVARASVRTSRRPWPHDRVLKHWRGHYDSNDAQIVTARDARALAAALGRSLRHIPDKPIKTKPDEAAPHLLLSGRAEKRQIRLFIAFCRRGAFQIR